jgi:hypothetical protein
MHGGTTSSELPGRMFEGYERVAKPDGTPSFVPLFCRYPVLDGDSGRDDLKLLCEALGPQGEVDGE